MILTGDIGGTNSRFGIYDGTRLCFERRLANADFPDFAAVIGELIGSPGMGNFPLSATRFAVAGPVDDDGRGAQMTNLSWRIDATALEARFGLPAVRIANDFAAAALGAVTSSAADLVTLQSGAPLDHAPRLVLGAGTGLGMAIVLRDGGSWRVIPGEGGHVAFAPADEEQSELLRFLRQRHGRVTWERAVSGPGLAAIHTCLAGQLPTAVDADPGAVGTEGLAAPDSVAGRALRLFIRLYGSYAGDMALACLPRGGVYLAGGIAAKILPALEAGFATAFNDKANHADLAARMPIHVATDPQLGLRGATLL
jgi:glucokinase